MFNLNYKLMKRIVSDKLSKSKYPYLGKSELGLIVLFTSANTGVQVNESSLKNRFVGFYTDRWAEEDFVKFTGTVTLSND